MRKILYILIVLLSCGSLLAEMPKMKIQKNDGSFVEYELDEIQSMEFVKSPVSSWMTIYRDADSIDIKFDTKYLDLISFNTLSNELIVTQDNIEYNYLLSNIDSITILKKEQRYVNVYFDESIPNIDELTISSFADFGKKFENGKSTLLINDTKQSQIVFVNNDENQPIAMGLVKSDVDDVRLNGLSSAATVVYNNVLMMGVPAEKCVDSVSDYIFNLSEVAYAGAILDDTINAGSPFMNAVNDDLKAILRAAYYKTYKYITGEDYGSFPGIVEKKEKIKDSPLSEELEVFPPDASGIIVTSGQNDNGDIWITIENTKRRHINIREGDESNEIIEIGPKYPVLGGIFSYIFDKMLFNNEITFKKVDGYEAIHTVGMSTNLYKIPYYNTDDKEMREAPISRTCSSIGFAVTETLMKTLIPIVMDDPKWIPVVIEIYDQITPITERPELVDKINNGDLTGALAIIIKDLEQNKLFWTKIFEKAGVYLTEEALESLMGMVQIVFTLYDMAFLYDELLYVNEYEIFNIIAPSVDIIRPNIKLISPQEFDLPQNENIPVDFKITDNEQVRKVYLYLDYSDEPIDMLDFGENAGKEITHGFNWNTGELLGLHYLTVVAEDASGNHNSDMKIIHIINNPNDKTAPEIVMLSPLGDEIETGSTQAVSIKITDDDLITSFCWYVDDNPNNPDNNYGFFEFADKGLKDTTIEVNWNISGYSAGEEHTFYCYAVDGGQNKKSLQNKFTFKSNNPGDSETVTIGNQIWMQKNLDVDHYRNGDPIRHCKTVEEWIDAGNKQEGAWCYYDNDAENGKIYGKLYNWYAVNDMRGLAPEGWHVPSDEEWKELEMFLGMNKGDAQNFGWFRGTNEGSKLAGKSEYWISGDSWTDSILVKDEYFGVSGFIGIPGGYRVGFYDPEFHGVNGLGGWWTSTENPGFAWYRSINSSDTKVKRYWDFMDAGYSVRCVRD